MSLIVTMCEDWNDLQNKIKEFNENNKVHWKLSDNPLKRQTGFLAVGKDNTYWFGLSFTSLLKNIENLPKEIFTPEGRKSLVPYPRIVKEIS